MRIATYTRISTDEEHQPFSLEAQSVRLDSYIASQDGWEKVRSFTDQGSGVSLDRPALQRALTEAGAGRFDLLLVYRVDRLARSVRGLAHILDELDKAKVAFRSATEPFDTATPAGRMMVQMLGVFAEFERATIVDRIVAGMERKAARGGWTVGGRPFGYRVDRETGFLVMEKAEAPLVPVIFDLYANRRLGVRAIAAQLNAQGHRTKGGLPWSCHSLLSVLRNRAYIGEIFFRGEHHQAPHPPLVDAAMFDAAQVVLRVRGEDISKRASNPSEYLLAGVVICARCGHRYVGGAAHGRTARYRYYRCFTRQRYGASQCDADFLPADALENAVIESLSATYARTDLLDKAIADHRSGATARPQLAAQLAVTDAEIRKAEEAIDRYLRAFENRTLSETHCGSRVRALAERLTELRNRSADLTYKLDDDGDADAQIDVDGIRRDLGALLAADAPGSVKKALLQTMIDNVRVTSRDHIEPTFRVPLAPPVRNLSGVVGGAGLEPATSSV